MRSRHAGFTLIEMLVVMVIMVLAYAMTAPMISAGVSGAELKAAARQIATGLRKARSEAVTRKDEVTLTVDVERRQFELGGDKRIYRLPKKIDVSLFTAQSELMDAKTGAIRFYPDGSSTGGRVTISQGERKYLVDVDWMTGRVKILD
jgi:general secretion pathway protein H